MLLLYIVASGVQVAFAEQPLLTLSVESSVVRWQDDFILTLTVYTPSDSSLPEIQIDGLDQFELKGTGKNLLQVPRGKTKKWSLTYTLVPVLEGVSSWDRPLP